MKSVKQLLLLLITAFFCLLSCRYSNRKQSIKQDQKQEVSYIFFLHNRFLEEFELTDEHPDYGRVEYRKIIQAFEKEGFTVLSEIRPKNTDMKIYANKIVHQIDSLFKLGVEPKNITIIGTSKGGYIAQYVSTYLKNPEVNFVFIGCHQNTDIIDYPEINYCGNILTIYEETDPFGVSAAARQQISKLKVSRFKEIELHTGLKHGFLYKRMDEWIVPSIQWAKRVY
jgi:hypothetical protein